VTLIATCLTHDFIIHVADRRTIDPYTGKPHDEEATKTVQFDRVAVWGYTVSLA
jgi:hypothetical protein